MKTEDASTMNEPTTRSTVQFAQWLERRARQMEKRHFFREAIAAWSKLLSVLTQGPLREEGDVGRLAMVHYHLGVNHQALNETGKSIYHLKYSIRLNSSEARYFEAYGRAYIRGGHWAIAKAQFERAVRLDQTNISYLRQYSWILLMMGKKKESLMYARKAFNLNSAEPRSRWMLSRVYFELDQYLPAQDLLRDLIADEQYSSRARWAYDECRRLNPLTLEEKILSSIRRSLKFDGQPFYLAHLKQLRSFWIKFLIREEPDLSRFAAHIWAAALCLHFCRHQNISFSLEQILTSFQTDSERLFPALSELERFSSVSFGSTGEL